MKPIPLTLNACWRNSSEIIQRLTQSDGSPFGFQPGLASFCRFVEKKRFFPWKNRPGKNSFCRAEKTTRQKPGKISFANICQVEKIDF
jgi:hypothetical protein